MSGNYIPKEQLTAYERWEMAAFDEAERLTQTMRMAEASGKNAQTNDPAPEAVDPEELAALREQAMLDGRQAGFEEGRQNGFAAGYTAGAEAAAAETARIAASASAFSAALRDSETALAEGILQLSLDVAQQVLRTSLRIDPELILPVVREAMAALISQHGHPTLILNPEDAAIIRPQLLEQIAHTGWRVMEDPTVARGGCKVENGGAEVDATLEDRWRRVVESLGQETTWLKPE